MRKLVKTFYGLFLLLPLVALSHGATVAVTISNGNLQAGTTTGYHVSSGTVRNFNASTATIQNVRITTGTASGIVVSTLTARNLRVNLKTYGAKGDLVADDTAALQAAIDATPLGATLFVPRGSYKITSQINITNNRLTIEGEGPESYFQYTPSVSSTTFFAGDGTLDNIVYRNFAVEQSNPTTRVATTAFSHPTGDTALEWDHVFVSGFSKYGIHLGVSVVYVKIIDCRFLRHRNPTGVGSVIPAAILAEGSNVMRIDRCLFAQNDRSVQLGGGSPIQILNSSFELDGDSSNPVNNYSITVTNTRNFSFTGNYIEGSSYPVNGGALYLNDTVNSYIANNYWSGEDGPTTFTPNFIVITGTATRNAVIEQDAFLEIKDRFILNTATVTLRNNYFRDGGSEITTHNGIMALMNDPTLIELDVTTYSTWNPNSISSATAETSPGITVTGAVLGNRVDVFPPYDLQGMMATGYVENSTGTVRIVLQNPTAGSLNLGSGSWGVRIKKAFR